MSAAVIRCDRCSRPATQRVQSRKADGVTGYFCGRHAAKSGLPCGSITFAQNGFVFKDAPTQSTDAALPLKGAS